MNEELKCRLAGHVLKGQLVENCRRCNARIDLRTYLQNRINEAYGVSPVTIDVYIKEEEENE